MALAAGGGAGFLTKRWRERSVMRRHELEELAGVRQLADEDVTLLGEQLQRLDAEVSGRELDEPARIDYQRALDAYESAQRAVPRIRDADEISKITDTLSTGRYALACVQARVAGRPVPEFRVPCFFNPQHGPSVTDIMWTPRGRGTRKVPACARDAARVANHERPEVRQVRIGSQAGPVLGGGCCLLAVRPGLLRQRGSPRGALRDGLGVPATGRRRWCARCRRSRRFRRDVRRRGRRGRRRWGRRRRRRWRRWRLKPVAAGRNQRGELPDHPRRRAGAGSPRRPRGTAPRPRLSG